MKLLDKILPKKDQPRKWVIIGLTTLIAGALTVWGIYGVGQYGLALFILTPLFIGYFPVVIYGSNKQVSRKDAISLGLICLMVFGGILFLCAIEGAICIAMAAPIAMALSVLGSILGFLFVSEDPGSAEKSTLLLLLAIPLTSFVEKDMLPETTSVITSIEINATPEQVWKNVIEFPPLQEPQEFLFKAGISYPTNAVIEGTGVGAVRHCNFTTGSFVEPVTKWNEPYLLAFDVRSQPAPMKELSFWDIDAPHLHDFFVSEKGQFKLTALPGGKTLLEGTTWYHHDIKPVFYWKIWSDLIIHKIHERVLTHIKRNSENKRN